MRRRQRGFTLLEVVIAVAIFALMFVLAQMAFHESLNNRDLLGDYLGRQEQHQRLLLTLSQDFEQMIARPARDGFGDLQPALRGTLEGVEFTRLGWANPFALRARSEQQRVSYLLDEDKSLIRRTWPVLDVIVGTEPEDTVLLEQVKELKVRYLDQGENGDWVWLERWPDVNLEQTPPLYQRLPRSVELTIELEDGRRIHRFFRTVVNPWAL
ncbi:type II secretion system minor pseudopilin GspJ [Isoalcanivorax beigongshangi]|uniref:Type II secretion system protein J n=1 Tax=Isoalcanivorax beigongshangi TaxID=3238810 RepID=A0ABV4AIU0_9GAMM